MRIRMPDVDQPGRIAVVTPAGTGLSAGELSPRIHVQVVPARAEVPEGVPISLTAVVTGSTDGRVEWRAKAQGGKAGTISSEGVYTPPLGRKKGVVTITAVSAVDGSASGARPAPRHPPSVRARAAAAGAAGRDGSLRRRSLPVSTLPAGALRKLTTIGLESVSVGEEDAPPGQVVVAAARITGGGPLSVPGRAHPPARLPARSRCRAPRSGTGRSGRPLGRSARLRTRHPRQRGAQPAAREACTSTFACSLDDNPPPPSLLPSIDRAFRRRRCTRARRRPCSSPGRTSCPGVTLGHRPDVHRWQWSSASPSARSTSPPTARSSASPSGPAS